MTYVPQQAVQGTAQFVAETALGLTDPNALQYVLTVTAQIPGYTLAYIVDEDALYYFDPTSVAAASPGAVIVPRDVTPPAPGRWLVFVGGGGPGSLVGAPLPYVVQPPGSLPDLAAAGWQNVYPTITLAIAAAVADGHDKADPTTITILPGTYTETVTPRDGIGLMGIGATQQLGGDQIEIVGDVVFTPPTDDTGVYYIENVIVTGQMVTGTDGNDVITLRRVIVLSTNFPAILVQAGGGYTHQWLTTECSFISVNDNCIQFEDGAAGLLQMKESSVSGFSTLIAIDSLNNTLEVNCEQCQFSGAVNLISQDGDASFRNCYFDTSNTPCISRPTRVGGEFRLYRCDFANSGDASFVIQTDGDLEQTLCSFRGTNQGIDVATLINVTEAGVGHIDIDEFDATVIAGAGETLFSQVSFEKFFQNDKLWISTLMAVCPSSSAIAFRVALADSGGVDIVTLRTFNSDEYTSGRTYLNAFHASIASPPLLTEAVGQSGSYIINFYATVAGSDMDFEGEAAVYGGSP